MRSLLCICAALGLCGPACAEGLFDPSSIILDSIAQELVARGIALDNPMGSNFDDPMHFHVPLRLPSDNADREDSGREVVQDWLDNRRHLMDYVIPDLCVAAPMLSDCRNFRPHIKQTLDEEEPRPSSVMPVNVIKAESD